MTTASTQEWLTAVRSKQPDSKTGVVLSAVNFEVVDKYLEKIGLPVDGGEYARVVRLHEAMQLVPQKGTRLGNCSTCRGKSHVELACCPFCGDGAIDESVIKARGPVAGDDIEMRVLDELRDLCAKKATEEQAMREKEDAKNKKASVGPEAGKVGLVQVLPGEGVRSRRAAKKDEKQLVIPAGETKVKEATVEDLDEAIVQIKALAGKAAETIFDAAVLLFDVHDRKLWMQRRDENGAPRYKTFTAWAAEEMPFTPQYCYELAELPKFFTREQVQRIGSTKLTLSLRVSEEERKRMFESGSLENMSVRDIKDRITTNPAIEARSDKTGARAKRMPGRSNRSKPAIVASGDRARKAEAAAALLPERRPLPMQPESIQLIACMIPTKIRFEMTSRPKDLGEPPVRARSLSDDPTGVITCANGAKIRITLVVTTEGFIDAIAHVESPVSSTADDDGEDEE